LKGAYEFLEYKIMTTKFVHSGVVALASFHSYFRERKCDISVTWPSSRTSATLFICARKAFSQFGQFDPWGEVEICSTERVPILVAFQLGSSRYVWPTIDPHNAKIIARIEAVLLIVSLDEESK
jgi:hypothetical protein